MVAQANDPAADIELKVARNGIPRDQFEGTILEMKPILPTRSSSAALSRRRVVRGCFAIFGEKRTRRIVELAVPVGRSSLDWKRIRGGCRIQDQFAFDHSEDGWSVRTSRTPTAEEMIDLRFAWAAVATVKSNAILLARGEQALGIGAGQMSRVDASFLAVHKARQAGQHLDGAVLASAGFFPFPDGVEAAAEAGVRAIIQPGGSIKDPDVIAAADRLGIAMVMTGARMFRH